MENFIISKNRKKYFEIVHEVSFPTMFRTFGSIFGAPDVSRKLKPMRRITDERNFKKVNSFKEVKFLD